MLELVKGHILSLLLLLSPKLSSKSVYIVASFLAPYDNIDSVLKM